ncbi:hypothetical protein Tco_1338223 [Tanacetum coccineum]
MSVTTTSTATISILEHHLHPTPSSPRQHHHPRCLHATATTIDYHLISSSQRLHHHRHHLLTPAATTVAPPTPPPIHHLHHHRTIITTQPTPPLQQRPTRGTPVMGAYGFHYCPGVLGGDTYDGIPCSPDCKIVGQILVDHPLSYALTATTNIPAVYLQQFWKTVRKVPNTNETIRFMLDRQAITYIVDMFRLTLNMPVETLDKPFIAPTTIEYIQLFMQIGSYQGDVDKQKKDQIQYSRFTKLIIADLMKKFPSIPQRLEEDYHSIKDDILLISVYTTGNVTVRETLIPNEFITDDIRATEEYKEYEKVFVGIDVPTIQPQPIESTQGTNRTPSTHRTPTPRLFLRRKGRMLLEKQAHLGKISRWLMEKMKSHMPVSLQIQFSLMEKMKIHMLEPGSHKENLETIDDDDNEEEKKDEKKDDDDTKDDHIDHMLVETQVTGSLETRKEKMQILIPPPPRSSRTNLSSNKTISKELTNTVSPTPDTTSQDCSTPTSINTKILPGSIAEDVAKSRNI